MGDCGLCVYTSYDGDAGEFVSTAVRKARKEYKCCECHELIKKGDQYERVAGKWETSLQTYRTCLACSEIREAFCCDGWIYGSLWEDFTEAFEGMTTGCLEKLTTAVAKKKLLERWNEWKFSN